jgi:hypothetical protein
LLAILITSPTIPSLELRLAEAVLATRHQLLLSLSSSLESGNNSKPHAAKCLDPYLYKLYNNSPPLRRRRGVTMGLLLRGGQKIGEVGSM